MLKRFFSQPPYDSFHVKFFFSDLVCLVLIFQISINHTVIHRVVQGAAFSNSKF